jgi:hypothetical protein
MGPPISSNAIARLFDASVTTVILPHSGVRERVLAIDLNLNNQEYDEAKEWVDDNDGLG